LLLKIAQFFVKEETMFKKAGFILIALVILGALVIASCQPTATATQAASVAQASPTPCVVKVGVGTMLTGTGAPMGTDILAGAQLAVEKINEEGGILGCQIEIDSTDIGSDTAENQARTIQKFLDDGIVFAVPGAFYGTAAIDEYGKQEWLMMHNSASYDMEKVVIDNLPEYRNVFMTCEDEYSYGPNAFNVIVNVIGGQQGYQFPNNKVALLGGDITYDMYIQKGARKAFEDAGWQVVLDDTYSYGNTEFGSQLAKIRAEEPAVIMGQLTSTDSSVAFVNQFLTNPTNSLIYIQWSPASPEFINLLGDKANGIMWQTLIDILPQNRDSFYSMFEQKFGRTPGSWPPMIWDHFQIWKAAVESCGSFTAYDCIDTYVEQLDQHPVTGLCGTYGMDPATHKGRSGDEWLPMQFIQIQDQKNVTLFLGTKLQENVSFVTPPWIH
jgi:branched-chain amino acid transport system substrate-binding protein